MKTKYTYKQIWTIAYPILISLIMEQMIGMGNRIRGICHRRCILSGYLHDGLRIQYRSTNPDCPS